MVLYPYGPNVGGEQQELEALRMYKLLTEGSGGGAGRLAGGMARIAAACPAPNLTTPQAWQQLVEWNGLASAVEWQVQITYETPNGGWPGANPMPGDFPPIRYANDVIAGMGGWNGLPATRVVAQIECGSGPVARKFYTDVRSGRFSLGVQERVRISVARWAANDYLDRTLIVQSTVGPAQMSDADPPTFSCSHVFEGGESLYAIVPPGAVWFDFSTSNMDPATFWLHAQALGGSGGADFYRSFDPAAPISVPSPGPWPLPAQCGQIYVRNIDAAGFQHPATLTFWVR